MLIQLLVPLGPRTTMRIGGKARHFAELKTQKDVEEAYVFAKEKNLPLIALGAGSNTIFADGIIEAFVVRIVNQSLTIQPTITEHPRNNESTNQRINVLVGAGLPLASLINALANHDLDLSALTGIPGTVGGAIFGNAGQGPQGVWLDHFTDRVTVFADGKWQSLTRSECQFKYRESIFKHWPSMSNSLSDVRCPMSAVRCPMSAPLIWEVLLEVPRRPKAEITAEIDCLLKKRLEAQPFARTAGSCFKALPDGTPAWKAIDAAGLKGKKTGGVGISEKHANFLISREGGTFADAMNLIAEARKKTALPLELEMRLFDENGRIIP